MTSEVLETLSKENAIERNTGPDGRKWGITRRTRNNLVEVVLEDGPRCNELPVPLRGQFTKENLAEMTITRFLEDMWRRSEETSQRSESLKRTKKAKEE